MTTETTTTEPTTINRGTVYTVTWRDPPSTSFARGFTPSSVRLGDVPVESASWLMIGASLVRLLDALGRHPGGDPSMLEFSPWTDLDSIADTFGRAFGFPGRIGFHPVGLDLTTVGGSDFGGTVSLVESALPGGVAVTVRPMAIGAGWVGLVAHVSPVIRVLAIPSSAVAIATANLLGSACRRTKSEALAVLSAHARTAYSSASSLLNLRKSSTGLPPLQARAVKLGQLVGEESALLCPTLFDFAEVGGQAAISFGTAEPVLPH